MAEQSENLDVREGWARVHARAGELLSQWPARCAIERGSQLWVDDHRSSPWHTSRAAVGAMSAALDHLHGLSVLLVDGRTLPVHSPFTLARGCIENAAMAVWILRPKSRPQRITRGLRWHASDVQDQYRLAAADSLQAKQQLAEARESLRHSALAGGGDPTEATRPVDLTEAIRWVDPHVQHNGVGPLFAWRWCSGFAHGRPWVGQTLDEHERRPAHLPGTSYSLRASSDELVLAVALMGLDLINLGLESHKFRARDREQASDPKSS